MNYYARIIVTAPRECINGCEIPEGSLAFRAKNTDIHCTECVDYEREHPG